MIKFPLFSLVPLLLVFLYVPSMSFAADTGMTTPRPLWNTEPVEDPEDEDKEKEKKKIRLKDTDHPNYPAEEVEQAPKEKLKKDINVDMNFARDAKNMAKACPQSWENQECLQATSQAALVMISQYGASLEHGGKKSYQNPLKEECAASTAATQEADIPAYAMKSAYTVCVNKIVDIADATGIKPDPSYFQLMYATIICMDKKPQCQMMEIALRKWGGQ